MNKYQEGLERVKTLIDISSDKLSDKGKALMMESVDILQELVDKATPKKTIYIDATLCILSHFICPVCRTKVNHNGLYCDNCGQALDWSDEDEKEN